MTPNEYQKLAIRTLVDDPRFVREMLGDRNVMLVWNALGLVGEVIELHAVVGYDYEEDSTKVKKELGDCYWYLAALAHVAEIDMLSIAGGGPVVHYLDAAGAVSEYIKKVAFHLHPYDKAHFAGLLANCFAALGRVAAEYRFLLADVWQANIDKLRARYPDGFDYERSINRPEEN